MSSPLPPGAFARALHNKREAARRRSLIVWSVAIGAAVLLGLGVYLMFFSPVFAADDVEVNGAQLLTPEQVEEAAKVEMGVPLARQDTRAIAERVQALAPVVEAKVSTDLPGTVNIEVTERVLVYHRVRDGQFDWVDGDGVIFHHSPEALPGVVQVVGDLTDQRLAADVATVVRHLPSALKPQIVTLSATAVDSITLTLTENRSVVWGSADESGLKGEVLAALLSVEATVYDVSAPRHPTTR